MPDINFLHTSSSKKIGVLLMTYGSATTSEHVKEYMEHIYKGKVPNGVVENFEERYRLVGHSPLVELTAKQASFLEARLNMGSKNDANGQDFKQNPKYIVRSGMLHSKPFIEDSIKECKEAGAEQCIGIILSPQFSSFIMDGYTAAFARAAEACGFSKEQFHVVSQWPTEKHFIELLASSVEDCIVKVGGETSVIFTTHSLPKRVVDKDPQYLDQLKMTSDAVLAHLNLKAFNAEWYSAYQSAGHTPEEWLKPDLVDVLAELKMKGKKSVLIVPIQFLTDHLEILYDLDIAAKKQCDDLGISYNRIELPNVNSLFIEALASLCLNGGDNFQN